MKEEIIEIFSKYILGKPCYITLEGVSIRAFWEERKAIFEEKYGIYSAKWDTTYQKQKIEEILDVFRHRISWNLHKIGSDLEGEILEKSNNLIKEFTTKILELDAHHAISFNLDKVQNYTFWNNGNRFILTLVTPTFKLIIT